MTFRHANGEVYKLTGSNVEESHVFTVAGKPKLSGEKEAKEKEASNPLEWINKIMAEGSGIALLLKMFMDSRDKSSEIVMEMLKAQISNGNGKVDSSAMLANVTDTLVKLKDAAEPGGTDPMQYIAQFMEMFNKFSQTVRPPVSTTGSNKSGIDSFFESLGAAAPAIVPMIAGVMGNRAAAAAPAPGGADTPPSNVIPLETEHQTPAREPEAFAGSGEEGITKPDPAEQGGFNPLAAFNAPDLGGADALSPQSAGFGAVYKLRYMIGAQADPLDVASEMVDVINLIQGAKRVDGMWENFIDDPGEAFDQFAPLILEWSEHPQYKTDCRAAMVKAVTEFFESDEEQEQQIEEATPADITMIVDEPQKIEEPPIENDDTKTAEEPVGGSVEATKSAEHDRVEQPV